MVTAGRPALSADPKRVCVCYSVYVRVSVCSLCVCVRGPRSADPAVAGLLRVLDRWPHCGCAVFSSARALDARNRSLVPAHTLAGGEYAFEREPERRALRAHALMDLGTQSAGPTHMAMIAADAAGPTALQSRRTGTVNGVPRGHAHAGRALLRINLAIVFRGHTQFSQEKDGKIEEKKAQIEKICFQKGFCRIRGD